MDMKSIFEIRDVWSVVPARMYIRTGGRGPSSVVCRLHYRNND